jgi:tRNA G18 (ribose-2'-O)-methylase SpoU
MGSESHGPGPFWSAAADKVVQIFPVRDAHPDSLNVSVSTGILLQHFCTKS